MWEGKGRGSEAVFLTHLFGPAAEARDDLALHLERIRGFGAGLIADNARASSHGGVALVFGCVSYIEFSGAAMSEWMYIHI